MKLLIVSHPSVTPINQQLFAAVEDHTQWEITLVGPSNWVDDYGTVRGLERWPDFEGDLRAIPVFGSGNIPLHVYRTTFWRLLRDVQPDALYVHNEPYAASTAQLWLANRWSGVQAAFGFYAAQNIVKKYPIPFRWTEQAIYRASQFSFPCSETVLDTLRTKGYTGPATLLPLGIDPTLYTPSPRADQLRDDLRGDADVLFGYLGRITEEKGVPTMLRAMAQLPSSLDWRLALVGTGDHTDAFRALAADLGIADRLVWVGYVEHTEAPHYLSAFDVLVLPSETQPTWKEQFGRVIVEALACETPVVGTNSGEIPRLLRRTEGGVVVEERDPTSLASGLQSLAESPQRRRRLAVQGAGYVRDHLTHRALAVQFAEAIERAVALSASPNGDRRQSYAPSSATVASRSTSNSKRAQFSSADS